MQVGLRVPEAQLSVRAAAAALIAILMASWLSFHHPLFAMLAAVITTDLSPQTSRKLGVRRIVSTLIGAAVGVLFNPFLGSNALSVAAGILIAMLVCQFLGTSEGARVAGFISGIIILEDTSGSLLYAVDRILETLLGVLVALGVSYVPKWIKIEEDSAQ